MNKRGEGTAFGWILGIIVLIGMGALFIILNQVMTEYVQPAFENVAVSFNVNETERGVLQAQANKYLSFWYLLPLIIFILVSLWIIVNSVRNQQEDAYK